jgi:Ca2+-transporting ATPase
VVLAAKGGVDPTLTREKYPRVAVLPFDAAYKLMATFHRMTNEAGAEVIRGYVKGAPDQLLARATSAHGPGGVEKPLAELRDPYMAENDRLGRRGLRVMATARRDFDPATFDASVDLLPLVSELTLLSMVGIVDPPRPAAKASIAKAHAAGIQVRMITGDHAVTAAAIADNLGITGRAITGAEFAALDDAEADRQIDDIGVIARVTPEHKVRLVDVLKRKGHIVAMTGDGVNDAPALKKADIGVAMGITGTEVSKEAAVMILTDDNFATIVRAVELGRALYDNLLKYIRFQMGCLFGFIWTFLGAGVLNILGGVPFVPQQALWVNFTTDIFQSIGLGMGAATEGLMDRPPRPARAQVMPGQLAVRLVIIGLLMGIGSLAVIQWASVTYDDEVLARTMGLVTFSFFNMLYGLTANDELGSMFSHATLSNGKLMQMSGLSLLAIIAGSQLDLLNHFLRTTPLNFEQWLLCLGVGATVVLYTEVAKVFRRRAAAAG